jgi:hypothetical protein
MQSVKKVCLILKYGCGSALWLIFMLIGLSMTVHGQSCYLDSINDNLLKYDPSGKLSCVIRKTPWFGYDTITHYSVLNYNSDSLMASITDYSLLSDGDTFAFPAVTRTYEYNNGLLSRIWWEGFVYYDDFVWNNNQIIEYKYYYIINDTVVDSTQTRILQFTYLNNNVSHFLYKELTGAVFEDDDYWYDNKFNPFSESTMALVLGDIFEYSSFNNWTGNSSGASRSIIYNAQNYPLSINTDWNNGNFTHETYTYDCPTAINERTDPGAFSVTFLPNPARDNFLIRNNFNQNIKEVAIYNLNGVKLLDVNGSDLINIIGFKPGLYVVECRFENLTLREKLIINTR